MKAAILVLFCSVLVACPTALPPKIAAAGTSGELQRAIQEHCAAQPNNSCAESWRRAQCESRGGDWVQFTNGCQDFCSRHETRGPVLCTMDMPMGCDCGDGRCWAGARCRDIQPLPEPVALPDIGSPDSCFRTVAADVVDLPSDLVERLARAARLESAGDCVVEWAKNALAKILEVKAGAPTHCLQEKLLTTRGIRRLIAAYHHSMRTADLRGSTDLFQRIRVAARKLQSLAREVSSCVGEQ